MEIISLIINNNLLLLPIIFACVFIVTYLWADKVITFLYNKSLGQREEVIELMNKMFIEADHEKLTNTMLLMSFGLGFVFFLLFWPNLIAGLIVGSIVTVGGWSVPKIVAQSLFEKRCNRFVDQMVDGMTIMANGIKSGLGISQAMERVIENLGGPIAQEFNLILSEVRVGRTIEEALNDLGNRIPRPDVQMFVTSVNILKETGGNLGETFDTISTTVRERQKIEKKIQALTAQGLTQGFILTMVPFVLLGVFFIMDPEFIMPLFTTTMGWILLAVMLTLITLGGVSTRKIVNIKV